MIIYIENPKDFSRKLLELINEFSNVSGYRLNRQKSVACLYINNKRSERQIKETISFTITSKEIKNTETNPPKETKDLYTKNYDTNERNKRRYKQMENYSMFLGGKNQYCENDYTTKYNLQILCYPYGKD